MISKISLKIHDRLTQGAFRISIITIGILLPICAKADPAPPAIGVSPLDHFYEYDKPYIICNEPLKTPGCGGECTDMKIRYNEMEHVNGRDAIPGTAAKAERIDTNGLSQRSLEIPFKGGALPTFEVGKSAPADCKHAVIWVHGMSDNKGKLGISDVWFGGAFNRMKHISSDNNGVYYSPTVTFDDAGKDGLVALIKHVRHKACPGGKIILNCGSAGAGLCWDVAQIDDAAKELSGLVLIGSGPPGFELKDSTAAKYRVPILITQGEKDDPKPLRDLVMRMHASDRSYPVRFIEFATGGHMTPLRMLDWRSTMNCMLNQSQDRRFTNKGSSTTHPSSIAQ